ncbi:MAG: hypothetical protein A3K68_01790 [Euryarchaeota archaeon RBG_16_68_13]|nr:MAG: hypothetical protein A3K68_01790 [Euryarchaeota archaeon RBG_16_68_13]
MEIINSHVIADRYDVWQAVDAFAPRLASLLTADLEPPEGADLAYALPGATSEQDVCALRERIQRHRGRFVVTGSPSFPATRDAAVPVLVAGRFHPGIRSSATLKYNVKNERPLRSTRLAVAPLERSRKPRTAHALERGIEQAIVEAGTIPDVVFDEGVADMRVLGRDPQDVVRKVRRIARSWNP